MGHIIKTEEDYNYLCDLVDRIYFGSFDQVIIEEIFSRFLPKDNDGGFLIEYSVDKTGSYYAVFSAHNRNIAVSLEKFYHWIDVNAEDLCSTYNLSDARLMGSYLCLLALLHKIEHSYQYLMATEEMEAPCKMVQEGYKTLFELLKGKEKCSFVQKVKRSISMNAYVAHKKELVLERNAQLDALIAMADIALKNNHPEIRNVLLSISKDFAVAGYIENNQGPLVNTFKKIHMGSLLENIASDYETMDMMDRYKFGLPVDEKTRDRILALRK